MKIGKGKYPSLLFIIILANVMNSTLEVFEVTSGTIRVTIQSVLKFRESLRVSREIALKKVGKMYKQGVPTFFRSFEERPSS